MDLLSWIAVIAAMTLGLRLGLGKHIAAIVRALCTMAFAWVLLGLVSAFL